MAQDNHVLILLKDQDELASLKSLFQNLSLEFTMAKDVQQAWDVLGREKIKVILYDNSLPEIPRRELFKKIQDNHPHIVNILITSQIDPASLDRAIEQNEINQIIKKPWDEDKMRLSMHRAFELHDLLEENEKLMEDAKNKIGDLEIANRRIKDMLENQKAVSSTISHELRTPLASIKMGVDIMMSGTAGRLTSHQLNFLNKVKNNIDRLKRLIDEILDLSKLESGALKLNLRLNNINQSIEDVMTIQEPLAVQKGLQMKMDLNDKLPDFVFDADKISQVLSNLIGNAIKFTDKGSIQISSIYTKDTNFVEIRIKDTGQGIAEDDIPRLFQKFQQLGNPAMRKQGGTGLGLAICSEIIKQHRGKIGMESKIKKGSVAFFVLPIHERRLT